MASMRCATCGQTFDPQLSKAMPFCSSRCRQIDLNRWLNEEISVPVDDPTDDGERRDLPERPYDDESE